MHVLITGVAGFIGFHCARSLLQDGIRVYGIDNLNAYYDPALKRARLSHVEGFDAFKFQKGDIADFGFLSSLQSELRDVTHILHLAAQPGVRSTNLLGYIESNVVGQMTMLELARGLPNLTHFVYASSSSVYGNKENELLGLQVDADHPISVYGATKRAAEILTGTYCGLYDVPATGLRYFTVYGPWGRPDMAPYLFGRALLAGEPIKFFNRGDQRRDFTYIDDIVAGTRAALERPPRPNIQGQPHTIYNLGAGRSIELLRFIELLEQAFGIKAIKEFVEAQPGDVKETWADISASTRDLGYAPRVKIEEGIPVFVAWLRDYLQA